MDTKELVDFLQETAVRFSHEQAKDGIRRSVNVTATSLCFFYSAGPHHIKYEFLPFAHLVGGTKNHARDLRDQSVARLERAIRYERGRMPERTQQAEE